MRLAARRHCSRPKIYFSGSFNFLAWWLFPMRGAHQQRQPEGAPPCAPAKAKQGPRRRHTVFFRSKTTAERRTRTRAMSVCSCFAGSATAQAGGLARRRHKSLQFFQIPSEARADTKSGFDQNAGILHVLTPSPARNSRSLHFWPGNYPVLSWGFPALSAVLSPD